jgi:hypothetical protein
MSLHNFFQRIRRRAPRRQRAAQAARTRKPLATRLRVEPLEARDLPSVVFDPQFPAESVPNTGQFTVLNNPPVYAILWGTQWYNQNVTPPQPIADVGNLTSDIQNVLGSNYWSGLSEYGNVGTPVLGGAVWTDYQSNPPANFNPGDLSTSTGQANLNAVQGEIQNAIAKSNGAIQAPPANATPTNSPIYAVIPYPNFGGGGAGYNTVGTNGSAQINIVSVGTYFDRTGAAVNQDGFGDTFSHELAERITDPTNNGVITNFSTASNFPGFVNVNSPNVNNNPNQQGNQIYLSNGVVNVNGVNQLASAQIGDGEQEPARQPHYGYRLNGVKVQSLWSNQTLDSSGVAGAFIVADGNSQTIYLQPIWQTGSIPVPNSNPSASVSGPVFTGKYNLIIRGDNQPAPTATDTPINDSITVNASDAQVKVTIDNQNFLLDNFADGNNSGQIQTIYIQPGLGTNTVNIQGLATDQTVWVLDGAFTLASGSAADTVTVGNNGDMSGILGQIIMTKGLGTVNNTLNIDDSKDSGGTGRTVTMGLSSVVPSGLVNPYAVSFSGGLATVIYAPYDVTAVTVSGDSFPNQFAVQGTAAGLTTTIAGNGADTVTVGAGSHNMQGIQGSLYIKNRPNFTKVILDDAADTQQHPNVVLDLDTSHADLTYEKITGLAQGTIELDTGGVLGSQLLGGTASGGDTYTIYADAGGPWLLKTGAGGDTVNVDDVFDDLTVDGNGSSNTVTVGDLGLVSGIQAAVSVQNEGSGLTALTVDDSSDPNNHTATPVTISSTSITGLAPNPISYGQTSLSALNIDVGFNNPQYLNGAPPTQSTFDIVSTPNENQPFLATTTTLTSGGSDSVTLGDASHNMQGIQGFVYVTDLVDFTSVTMDDAGDTQQHTNVSLTSGSSGDGPTYEEVTGLAPAVIELDAGSVVGTTILGGTATGGNTYDVYDTQAGPWVIRTGAGGDAVNVHDTSQGLTVDGQGANNAVNVGDGGQVGGVRGAVAVQNEASGLTALTVDDSRDPTAQTVTIQSNAIYGINGFTDPTTTGPWLSYSGLSSLTFNGGTPSVNGVPTGAGNAFFVQGTAPMINGTTLNTGGGTAGVTVSDAGGTLNGIQGALAVNGRGPATLAFNDLNGTPASAPNQAFNYNLVQNSFNRTGTATVTYGGMASVTIQTANTGLGPADDIGVTSTAAGTTYQINAGTGYQTFSVGDAPFTLNGIQGSLYLHGAGGTLPNDQLGFFYDVDRTTHHTFVLTGDGTAQGGFVQRDGMANIHYDGFDGYIVLGVAGSIGATVNVESQASSGYTYIEAGSPDKVVIGNTSHTMAGILGDIGIVADPTAAQTPTVTLDDARDPSSRSITLSTNPTYGYQIAGLLPPSSVGRGLIWLAGTAMQVTLTTGAGSTPTNDVFQVNDVTAAPVMRIDAGNGTNTLMGPNQAMTWTVSAANSVAMGTLKFSHMQNLVGGSASDVFKFEPRGSLPGTINGGGGGDWLDYSAFASGVAVNLSGAAVNGVPANSATGVSGGVFNVANVRGGSGNNVLIGGGGNILVGGAGNDVLIDTDSGSAATGGSLLIGGAGSDTLTGGAAGDILIGEATNYDSKNANLQDILTAWDTMASHAAAFAALQAKGGVGATHSRLVWGVTVKEDSASDVLRGAASPVDLDWFFAGIGDTTNARHGKDFLNNGLA